MNYYYACCCLISYYQAMLRFVSVSPILDMLYVITKCYPSTELYCSCGFTNESVSFSFIKAIFSCQNSYNNSHWYTSEIWTLFGRRKHKITLCHIQSFYKISGRLYNFSKIQLHTDYLQNYQKFQYPQYKLYVKNIQGHSLGFYFLTSQVFKAQIKFTLLQFSVCLYLLNIPVSTIFILTQDFFCPSHKRF